VIEAEEDNQVMDKRMVSRQATEGRPVIIRRITHHLMRQKLSPP